MCKLMIMTGIENSKLALEFMKAAAKPMSIADVDGIGYSAINSKNELFMEKWHNNSKFLDRETVIDSRIVHELEAYKARLPFLTENYTSYGNVTLDDLKTVTMHTRMATCGKTFENVHPFIDQDVSLIHNGIIQNAHIIGLNKISSCDSENALQLYIKNQINLTEDPEVIQSKLLDVLQGYWAFAFLTKDVNGQYMLDLVREGATLYWTTLPEIGENCMVFATTENIIRSSISMTNLAQPKDLYLLPESNYHRINAITGETLLSLELDTSEKNKPMNSPIFYSRKALNTATRDYSDPNYLRDHESIADYDYPSEDFIDEDLTIESFYDIGIPLIDRLYEFDDMMMTDYGRSFEELPINSQNFLQHREEQEYLIFDDVLKIIEEFNATKTEATIFKVYREIKRA